LLYKKNDMNNPFNFFDKIFCINLKTRPDRWQECLGIFEQLNIQNKVIKFEAVDLSRDTSIIEMHRGRCGCAQSHLDIIKDAKKNNYQNILIFEDDIKLHSDTETVFSVMSESINELPPDWEIFYPSANPPNHWESLANYSKKLCQVKAAFTTHSIAINSNIFDLLLERFNSYGDVNNFIHKAVAVDNFYTESACSRGKVFLSKKLLFTQRNNYSNIDLCDRDINNIIITTYTQNPLLEP